MLASACYGPNPDYLGVADSAGTTSTSGSAESGESGTGTDGSTTGTESTDTAELADTTDLADTTEATDTTGVDPSCGDGSVDVGEFCFAYAPLLTTTDVHALAAADFDDDGRVDLAIARKDDLLVLFGAGNGEFPIQADLPEDNGNYFGLAAGDLDGDRIADLVVASESTDALIVYRSLGGGSFADPVPFFAGDQPKAVALARLDGDANLDAAVALQAGDAVAILLGAGDGAFQPATSFAGGGNDPLDLGLGLFDVGQSLDIVLGNHNDSRIGLLHGDGSGQFGEPSVQVLSGRPASVAVADLNLDGSLDVAAALEDVDLVELLLGDGSGELTGPMVAIPVGARPFGVIATDLDNDLVSDLLVINRDENTVGVLFNDGGNPGNFVPHQTLVWFNGLTDMRAIIAADLDADTVPDVIVGGDGVRAMLSDP